MSIYWYRHGTIKHPNDVKQIRDYLENNGIIVYSDIYTLDKDIEELYERFSKEECATNWLTVSDKNIYAFSLWLEDLSAKM